MDSGSYPLNHTIPPFASGDPMICPPTFTWYVVAARALDAEKTKTNSDRIEMIARTFGVSHFDFVTLSHMTAGHRAFRIYPSTERIRRRERNRNLAPEPGATRGLIACGAPSG